MKNQGRIQGGLGVRPLLRPTKKKKIQVSFLCCQHIFCFYLYCMLKFAQNLNRSTQGRPSPTRCQIDPQFAREFYDWASEERENLTTRQRKYANCARFADSNSFMLFFPSKTKTIILFCQKRGRQVLFSAYEMFQLDKVKIHPQSLHYTQLN